MNLIFDTQQVYRTLAQEGRFTDEQADVLTDALRNVATHNFENLATKGDLSSTIGQINAELKIVKRDLMIFTGAAIAAGVTFLAALMQLLG